jgi:ubiquinone/menaquinone biosynthesis C-methylase UbiE
MAAIRVLSHDQVGRFYDRLGAGIDTQAFYERAARRDLVAHLELGTCRSLVEFGCGTGSLAEELLDAHLPPEATYLGLDVSKTMVGLANRRLGRFGGRAQVRQCDGMPRIDAADGAFDRFISTYVLEVLSEDEIGMMLKEARRVVEDGGLFGYIGLANGVTPLSRLWSMIWSGVYRLSPWLVGGSRPISAHSFVSNSEWRVDHANTIVRFGVPSEIVVARAVPSPRTTSS